MKAIEQYFHVVLFIMLYKMILTFKSVVKTLVHDECNNSYVTSKNYMFSCVAIHFKIKFELK